MNTFSTTKRQVPCKPSLKYQKLSQIVHVVALISNPTNHMYTIASPVNYCVGWNFQMSTSSCTRLSYVGGETVQNSDFASGLIGCPTG